MLFKQLNMSPHFNVLDEDKVNELDAIGRTTAMYATNGGTADYLDCLTYLIDKGVDLQHHSTGV